jgi:hypothetical protein
LRSVFSTLVRVNRYVCDFELDFASLSLSLSTHTHTHTQIHTQVPQMMYIMQSMLLMYFEDHDDDAGGKARDDVVTRANAIDELNRKHHLLGVLMDELESFKKSCETRIPGNETRLVSVFIDPQVVREKHWQCTYDEQIQARLDFLSLVLSSSSLLVTNNFAKIMWHNLIVCVPNSLSLSLHLPLTPQLPTGTIHHRTRT